jgi:NMD protein affecting ribosome stability and mRNA decay
VSVQIPCFKCAKKVSPEEAVYTRKGDVACADCAKALGIKTEQIVQVREVTRMLDRETIEAEREKLNEMAEAGGDHSVIAAAVVEALDWTLGSSRWAPSEKLV